MGRTTVKTIHEKYRSGKPISMLTAYDAEIGRLVDAGGVDIVLVGDSAADNHHGYDDTLSLTLDEALSNTAAVSRGVERALVVADMPFLAYGTSVAASVKNAGRFLREAGAHAVKLETTPGGHATIAAIDRMTELGIPVQGHIGYTPQHSRSFGGAVIQGRDETESVAEDALVDTAIQLADAGVFSIVLETVTETAAKRITEAVDVPTIGIGAGRYVDGQVLVVNDVIGLGGSGYKLAKSFASVGDEIEQAVKAYVDEVEQRAFPSSEHVFDPYDE